MDKTKEYERSFIEGLGKKHTGRTELLQFLLGQAYERIERGRLDYTRVMHQVDCLERENASLQQELAALKARKGHRDNGSS